MGTAIYVLPLLNKLRKLPSDVLNSYPKFKDHVDKLQSFLIFLENDEDRVLPVPGKLLSDAEDKIDEFILRTEEQKRKRTHQLLLLLSPLNHKNYTLDLDKIISELHQMQLDRSRGQSNTRVGTGHTMEWENIPGYFDEASNIVVREKEIEELVKRLLEDKSRVIPVVGEAGSGKTTLVSKIYNRVDIKQHFECCAWIHFSTEISLLAKEKQERNLLGDIVKQVMVMINGQRLSNEELKLRLRNFLERKRYLIVLDGVHTTDVWDSLIQALPADTENGSKIILTTVDDYVAKQANPEPGSAFQLRLLTDEESWALFLNKLTTSVAQQTNPTFSPSKLLQLIDEESGALFLNNVTISAYNVEKPDLIDLRYQILRICEGFPLAILLLGGLFSTINLFEWSGVIEHEHFAEYESTLGEYESVFRSLAMSYQGLPHELKCCVLYMCLFPRENEIAIRRLFGLWIAENMVTPKEERIAEDLAQIYFNELVGRNMIEVAKWRSDGRPNACRMPGIIYDFLLPKALSAGFLYVHGNAQNSTDFGVKRCANFFPVDTDTYQEFRSLHSYVSSDTRQQGMPAVGIGMLLMQLAGKRCYGLLMVLDLEGVYKPVLPKELGKLLLLRYLGLRSTVLDSLPSSVEELQWLETLDVKHTNITNLPSSILKGKKLRHLYLNGINLDMSIEKQSSGSLGDLQTLSGIAIGSEDSIRNGLNRFTGLRKLGLTCHWTAMEAVVDWISKLTNLQTLKLRSVDTFLEPSGFKWSLEMMGHCKLSHLYFHGVLFPRKANLRELPQNLEILTLSLSRIDYDPMPILGELHHLKTVRLLAQSYLGQQMICNRGSFPQLRILKLWMLKELEEWRMEEEAMPCLRELEIRRCQKLKKLVGLQHAATLKELILTNMPEGFVTDDLNKTSIRTDVFINIKNWDLSASDLWDDTNVHDED